MDRILYIVGPTATGKTDLALRIANYIQGELISADSRQVYQGMTIGSGKDIPSQAVKQIHNLDLLNHPVPAYQTNSTAIWGYDLVNPDQEWSIAQFYQFANAVITHLHHQNKTPLIVGGTGFYTQSIQSSPSSIITPPNQALREELKTQTIDQLQQKLQSISPDRFNQLNQSDKNNPRRLIRAIEIKLSPFKQNHVIKASKNYQSLWIGLDLNNQTIDHKIFERVHSRIDQGFDQEVKDLIKQGFLKDNTQASTATGYRQWLDYLKGNSTRDEAIDLWITAEKQYARRQKTWFKKQPYIRWFDASDPKLFDSVVDLVKNWYANRI